MRSTPESCAGRPARGCRATGTSCAHNGLPIFIPCDRSGRRSGTACMSSQLGTARVELPSSKALTLSTTSATSCRDVPARECDRLAELSALFHGGNAPHPRPGPRLRGAHPGQLSGGPPGVRAAALVRYQPGHPHLPPARDRGSALPAPGRGRRARPPGAARGRGGDDRSLAVHDAAAPGDRAELLPSRVPRGALLGGDRRGPRAPHHEIRTADAKAQSCWPPSLPQRS